MPANITDLANKISNGSQALPTTLSADKGAGVTTASLNAATGWDTTTAKHIRMYKTKVVNGQTVVDTTKLCYYKATLSGTTLSNITLIWSSTGSDQAFVIGDSVDLAPTTGWGDDLVDGFLEEHAQDGTHTDITADSITVPTLNSVTLSGVGLLGETRYYTSTTDWTKPAGLKFVEVEVRGAGGGGGGIGTTSGTAAGGGGGQGQQSIKKILAGDLAGTVTATVGTGGTAGSATGGSGGTGVTSSFGSHVTATGGGGGTGSNGATTQASRPGGTGGNGGTGGDFYLAGDNGYASSYDGNSIASGAGGGGGGGSSRSIVGSGNAGVAGTGGGGAGGVATGTTGQTGGAGGSGYVIVKEYF
jgi:hypothetical protein